MKDIHELIAKQLRDRRDSLDNRPIVRGILTDCLAQEKPLYVNLLMMAYDGGVYSIIKNNSDMKSVEFSRLQAKIVADHGISTQYAQWAITTWILSLQDNVPEDLIEAFKREVAHITTDSQKQLISSSEPKSNRTSKTITDRFKDIISSWFGNQGDEGSSQDIESLRQQGDKYYDGNGVPQDYQKAISYYEKAANVGDAASMNRIGQMYCDGYGVEKDSEIAIEWFKKAANTGNALGMHNLGTALHEQGNNKEAIKWFKKAADAKNLAAMFVLGYMYYYGEGVACAKETGKKWITKSADGGNEDARLWLQWLEDNECDKKEQTPPSSSNTNQEVISNDDNIIPNTKQNAVKLQLHDIYLASFKNHLSKFHNNTIVDKEWLLTRCHTAWGTLEYEISSTEVEAGTKKLILSSICHGKYSEDEVVHARVDESLAFGWVLTVDSICALGRSGKIYHVPYDEIKDFQIIQCDKCLCGGNYIKKTKIGGYGYDEASDSLIYDDYRKIEEWRCDRCDHYCSSYTKTNRTYQLKVKNHAFFSRNDVDSFDFFDIGLPCDICEKEGSNDSLKNYLILAKNLVENKK